ncbi:MAG TPA: hypothetical protein VK577_03945, partial [Bradyrhizobium sp.]|nr:hypothetical protein [Bradyrhizobium sp.]
FGFSFQRAQSVIASAAKQSILPLRGEMDCFAALAMTTKHTFTTSPRNAPEPLINLAPSSGKSRGCSQLIARSDLAVVARRANSDATKPSKRRHSGMRHLAQARNPYSRSWLWIPGSLASLAMTAVLFEN